MNFLCCFLAEIREAFRVLDRDGNGFISKQELGMAMRSLGYMPSEVELAIIMQRLDMDGETCLVPPGCASCLTPWVWGAHNLPLKSPLSLHVRNRSLNLTWVCAAGPCEWDSFGTVTGIER